MNEPDVYSYQKIYIPLEILDDTLLAYAYINNMTLIKNLKCWPGRNLYLQGDDYTFVIQIDVDEGVVRSISERVLINIEICMCIRQAKQLDYSFRRQLIFSQRELNDVANNLISLMDSAIEIMHNWNTQFLQGNLSSPPDHWAVGVPSELRPMFGTLTIDAIHSFTHMNDGGQ